MIRFEEGEQEREHDKDADKGLSSIASTDRQMERQTGRTQLRCRLTYVHGMICSRHSLLAAVESSCCHRVLPWMDRGVGCMGPYSRDSRDIGG